MWLYLGGPSLDKVYIHTFNISSLQKTVGNSSRQEKLWLINTCKTFKGNIKVQRNIVNGSKTVNRCCKIKDLQRLNGFCVAHTKYHFT